MAPAMSVHGSEPEPPTTRLAGVQSPEPETPLGSLGRLPPELRNRIYEYVLRRRRWSFTELRASRQYLRFPALLRASRAIRTEALLLYLSINDWYLPLVRRTRRGGGHRVRADTGGQFRFHDPLSPVRIDDNVPLFTCFQIDIPCLPSVFRMIKGVPTIRHCSCLLCHPPSCPDFQRKTPDSANPSDANDLRQLPEEIKVHDRDTAELETWLFKDLEISPSGFSVSNLRRIAGRLDDEKVRVCFGYGAALARLSTIWWRLYRNYRRPFQQFTQEER